MRINNSAPIAEMVVKAGNKPVVCDAVKGKTIHVAYSLYHPYIKDLPQTRPHGSTTPSLSLTNNKRAYSANLGVLQHKLTSSNGISGSYAQDYRLVPQPDTTCTYTANLTYSIMRHNGKDPERLHTVPRAYFHFETD